MRTGKLRNAWRHLAVLASTAAVWTFTVSVFAPSATENAAANGDTRTLHLYHTHTGETIDATFRVDGRYDTSVLRQLNHFLRDWRNDDEHEMDPRLFDAVWEAYRTAGATDRVQIYSAYRSPETNAMLRRRSRAVAEHSQHMLGKAMDTTMPGFPMERIREAGMRLQHGGVGWYPSANFVHLDVGGVRSWPRMSYDQLAGLFPDGKTVHIAADGRTMPGYDQARIEIAERGGTEVPPAQQSSGFFAWLFGGGNTSGTAREDEEDRRAPTAAAPVAVASAPQAQPAPEPQQQAQSEAPPAQTAALAYASAEPQGQPPAAGQAPSANGAQLASLEPADKPDAVMPLPPRRPLDLAAFEMPDVPLPPIRPASIAPVRTASIRYSDAQSAPLQTTDQIGGMITASTSGVPMIRKSRLPAIITRGAGAKATPATALAFAAAETATTMPELHAPEIVPSPVARPANLGARPVGLRAAAGRRAANVSSVPRAVDPAPVVAGPKLTGLRKAALEAEKAAL